MTSDCWTVIDNEGRGNEGISKSGLAGFIAQIRRSFSKRDRLSQLTWYDDGHETTRSYHFDQCPIKSVKETAGNCFFTVVSSPIRKLC
jgi:hypothetical protein